MRIFYLIVCLSILETCALSAEEPIKLAVPKQEDLSPAEIAIQIALDKDPTYSKRDRAQHSQSDSVEAWLKLTTDQRLTSQQLAFAWWRIGSLYAYNFNSANGSPNWESAADAFREMRKCVPNTVSIETLNAALVFATLGGEPSARAERLADSLKWITSIDQQNIQQSAEQVFSGGHLLEERLVYSGTSRTKEQRIAFLSELVEEHRRKLINRITEEIKYSQDEEAIATFLQLTEGIDVSNRPNWETLHRNISPPTGQPTTSGQPIQHQGSGLSRMAIVVINLGVIITVGVLWLLKTRTSKSEPESYR